jgi:hypothetical protein
MTQIYEPIMEMVPREARGKLEPAEIYHEILVHRWYLSERAGHEIGIFDTARDYIDNVLTQKPDELITAESDPPATTTPDAVGPGSPWSGTRKDA